MVSNEPAPTIENYHTNDRFFDLRALSGYSCLAVPTLRDYMRQGMPHFKLRGKVLVKRGEFDEWIESFRVKGNRDLNSIVDGVIKGLSD